MAGCCRRRICERGQRTWRTTPGQCQSHPGRSTWARALPGRVVRKQIDKFGLFVRHPTKPDPRAVEIVVGEICRVDDIRSRRPEHQSNFALLLAMRQPVVPGLPQAFGPPRPHQRQCDGPEKARLSGAVVAEDHMPARALRSCERPPMRTQRSDVPDLDVADMHGGKGHELDGQLYVPATRRRRP